MKRVAAVIFMVSLVSGAFWAGTKAPRCASAQNGPASTNAAVLLPGFKITQRTAIGVSAENIEVDILPGFEVLISKGTGAGGLGILRILANPEDDTKTYVEFLLNSKGGYSFGVQDTRLSNITHVSEEQFDVTAMLGDDKMRIVDTNRDGYADLRFSMSGPNRGKKEALRWSTPQAHELYQAAHPDEDILLQEVKPEFLRNEVEFFYGYKLGTFRAIGERFTGNVELETYIRERLETGEQFYASQLEKVSRLEEMQELGYVIYKYNKKEGRTLKWGLLMLNERGEVVERIEGWTPNG